MFVGDAWAVKCWSAKVNTRPSEAWDKFAIAVNGLADRHKALAGCCPQRDKHTGDTNNIRHSGEAHLVHSCPQGSTNLSFQAKIDNQQF